MTEYTVRPEDVTLTGWHGPAQHTYTSQCDGNHPPGPCPGDFAGHCRKAWAEWLENHDDGLGVTSGDLEEAFKDGFAAGAAYTDFARGTTS